MVRRKQKTTKPTTRKDDNASAKVLVVAVVPLSFNFVATTHPESSMQVKILCLDEGDDKRRERVFVFFGMKFFGLAERRRNGLSHVRVPLRMWHPLGIAISHSLVRRP